MRPRLIAVDDLVAEQRANAGGFASMRPRLIAVDDHDAVGRARGKSVDASMRPRLIAVDDSPLGVILVSPSTLQ